MCIYINVRVPRRLRTPANHSLGYLSPFAGLVSQTMLIIIIPEIQPLIPRKWPCPFFLLVEPKGYGILNFFVLV